MRRIFPYLLAPLLALASCGAVQKQYNEAERKIVDIADTLEVSAGYTVALEGTAVALAAKRYRTQLFPVEEEKK